MKMISMILLICLMTISLYGYDLESGRRLGLAGGVILSEPRAAGWLDCPTAVIEPKQVLAEAGYRRRYDLSELDKVFLAGAYRYNDFALAVGFSQFGRRDYYVEQIIKGSFTYYHKLLAASLSASGKLLDIGRDERQVSLSALGMGAALGVHYGRYHLALVGDNLNRPRLDPNRDREKMTVNVFGQIEGLSRFSVVGRMFWEEEEKACFSLGQYFHLPGDNALFVGIQSDPLSYGGGLDISYAGFGLSYAVRHHPTLGFIHNVSLTYAAVIPEPGE
jgi:hypothetical protein